MLTTIRLTSLPFRRYGGQTEKQKERKLRVNLSFDHKDFTKNSVFKEHMQKRAEYFKQKMPYIPLSRIAKADPKTVSRKRRPFMSTSPMINAKVLKNANNELQKQASGAVKDIWDKEGGSLRNKFFLLDHTAEVLENYRRIKENEIFSRIVFEEREKKAFLKKEARQTENLIEDFDQRFPNYKYFSDTDGSPRDFSSLHGSRHLFIEETLITKNLASKALLSSGEPHMINENKEYQSKQKLLQNKRLDKLFTPRNNNAELQKYLEDKSNYETASLGETSADELALKSGEDSDKRVDIVRASGLAQSYEDEQRLAAQVAQYEKEIIDKYHKLDLYRAKGKPRAKISFNDMTLVENLSYIKHNLQTSEQAFELFKITQVKYESNPEIAASIVQKLANRSNLKAKEIPKKLLGRYEYKNMLKSIQKNLELLDNKQAVDTLFSIGKLHKHQPAKELSTEHPEFLRYFEYFLKDLMKDQEQRVPELQQIQVAYLCKGLTSLRKVLTPKNQEEELKLRELIKQHAIINCQTYDPYSISKVLRYLFSYNDGSDTAVATY